MAVRYILPDSDPMLRKKSRNVTEFGIRLHILLDDMRQTLIEANGLGLAAPQVGVLRRAALIVDTSIDSESVDEQIVELINPEILKSSGELKDIEGCLSIQGLNGIVARPEIVEIKAQDRHGNEFSYTGNELTARAICHEIDHLDGILYTDIVERFLTEEEIEEMRAKNAEVED